jgi:hypothetical protein
MNEVERAYQMGRLEVTGEVNVHRISQMNERLERLTIHLEQEYDEHLRRKARKLCKKIDQACEVALRNEAKLRELTLRELTQ